MITKEKYQATVYKGDYKPISAIKNGRMLAGYSGKSVQGASAQISGTYNFAAKHLTVNPAGNRESSINIAPPPYSFSQIYSDGKGFSCESNSDGTFNFTGTKCLGDYDFECFLPAGTYTFSATESEEIEDTLTYCFKFILPTEFSETVLPATLTLAEDQWIKIGLYAQPISEDIAEDITLDNLFLQINEGGTAYDFTKSKGSKYSPPSFRNPKPLQSSKGNVAVSGKNIIPKTQIIFDSETKYWPEAPLSVRAGVTWTSDDYSTITAKGSVTGSYSSFTIITKLDELLEDGETYTLSQNSSDPANTKVSLTIINRETNIPAFSILDNHSFTVNKSKYTYKNYHYKIYPGAKEEIIFKPQLEFGSKATPFQPNFSKTVNIPELRSIEVDEDKEYNFSKTNNGEKEYFICDTFENGIKTQRVGELAFDGSEDFEVCDNAPDGFSVFKYTVTESDFTSTVSSSHFKFFEGDISSVTEECILAVSNDTEKALYFVAKYKHIPKMSLSFKSWIAQQSSLGYPLKVYYRLENPIISEPDEGSVITTAPLFTFIKTNAENGYDGYLLSGEVKTVDA